MINKVPIRIRLTILSMILLTICCIGLTIILNLSANKMADVIEAVPIEPATDINNNVHSNFNTPAATTTPSMTARAARKDFKSESILYMLLIICTGGILTYYLSGKALEPLNELNSQIKNINVNNLSEDIKLPEAKDEIYDITTSFNEMTHKLNDSFLMQKRFSQNAAHELRTPLTVLKTKLDVFKKKNTHTADEYNSLVEVISSHTDRLSSLVKSLLDLTNMNDIDLNENITLYTLIENIKNDLSSLSNENHNDINIKGKDISILGNYHLLYRAFYNVVENAIKYSDINGKIDIEISSNKDKAIVKISDTGIGIPNDMKKDIFEPFFRVDKSRSRQIGGAGLGLSIVKAIIEKHNGTIAVTDNGALGTTFEITLYI